MEPTIGSPAQAASEQDRQLHARLLARDAQAPSDLTEQYLLALVTYLRRVFPERDFPLLRDSHLIEEAAEDALFDLAKHPEHYDPARSTLISYLRMAARGDLRNKLQREARHRRHLVPLPDENAPGVEQSALARNSGREDTEDPALLAERREQLNPQFQPMRNTVFSDQDRTVIQLILDGERRTSVYAQILGITHLPESEQRREVKRVKDRLLKRLRRLAPQVKRDD